MSINDFYVFLQEHLARRPVPDLPLRIRVGEVEYDIAQIWTSASRVALEAEPTASDETSEAPGWHTAN